jgi:S1-C subfamily serine protease
MHKVIGTLLIASLVIGLLIWSTPVARLGSGFLIGNARYVLTYYDVVKESEDIQIKFPNEDNIPAKPIYKDQTDNLAILELMEPPKVKREPLFFQKENVALKENYIFSLGYPWTNTLEDKHALLEGSLVALNENATGLLKIDMEMEPIHSGSPLFNRNREVVGMVISAETLKERGSYSGKLHPAIPSEILIDLMKKNKIPGDKNSATTLKDLSMDEFIKAIRNNVVLIEAR